MKREEKEFLKNREYIRKKLERIDKGKEGFVSSEEFKEGLDKLIAKYEEKRS